METLRKAPAGKFRVIGKDNRADSGWLKGDYTTLDEAISATTANSTPIIFQIYDDKGECRFDDSLKTS